MPSLSPSAWCVTRAPGGLCGGWEAAIPWGVREAPWSCSGRGLVALPQPRCPRPVFRVSPRKYPEPVLKPVPGRRGGLGGRLARSLAPGCPPCRGAGCWPWCLRAGEPSVQGSRALAMGTCLLLGVGEDEEEEAFGRVQTGHLGGRGGRERRRG